MTLEQYLSEMKPYGQLSKKDEKYWAELWIMERDENAREKLVLHNHRLILFIARALSGNEQDLLDNIQNGSFGLWNGLRSYKYYSGSFSTWAYPVISRQIVRTHYKEGKGLKVLEREVKMLAYLGSKEAEYFQRHGQTPPKDYMIGELNAFAGTKKTIMPKIDTGNLDKLMAQVSDTVSLDVLNDDGNSLLDFLANDLPGPEETAVTNERKRMVTEGLKKLNDDDEILLRHRFGIFDDDMYDTAFTLGYIAEIRGTSREYVRQTEGKALRAFGRAITL